MSHTVIEGIFRGSKPELIKKINLWMKEREDGKKYEVSTFNDKIQLYRGKTFYSNPIFFDIFIQELLDQCRIKIVSKIKINTLKFFEIFTYSLSLNPSSVNKKRQKLAKDDLFDLLSFLELKDYKIDHIETNNRLIISLKYLTGVIFYSPVFVIFLALYIGGFLYGLLLFGPDQILVFILFYFISLIIILYLSFKWENIRVNA